MHINDLLKELYPKLFILSLHVDQEEIFHMKDEQLLQRITLNQKIMAGKPVIKGTRLTVEYILNLLAHGETVEKIVQEYEGLNREDIQACLLFANKFLGNTSFMPLVEETKTTSRSDTAATQQRTCR